MSIGARYFKEKNRKKVLGADMLPGIVLALSYDKFPFDATMYLEDVEPEYISIDWDNLGVLVDRLAEELNLELKPLTPGSAKQYLHALRHGYRANRNGDLPQLDVKFSLDEMMLYIPRGTRNFEADLATYDDLPKWIFGE